MKWVCSVCGKRKPTAKMTSINVGGLNCCDHCARDFRKAGR